MVVDPNIDDFGRFNQPHHEPVEEYGEDDSSAAYDAERAAEDAHENEKAEAGYAAHLQEELAAARRDVDMGMGCFAMIRETLAALDQKGYDGKATPPMMLNDWAAVIIARDRKHIKDMESAIDQTIEYLDKHADADYCDRTERAEPNEAMRLRDALIEARKRVTG